MPARREAPKPAEPEPEPKTCEIPGRGAFVPAGTPNLDLLCGCTRIVGDLAIDASASVDLRCLRDAREITGELVIRAVSDSGVSMDLRELEQLQRVGTLSLSELPLSDLEVFANLQSAEAIALEKMTELRDLRGLAAEIDRLQISGCDALTDLRGLRASVRELWLEKNARLHSLSGFIGLPADTGRTGPDVRIDDCPELQSVEGLFGAEHPWIYRLQLFSLPKLKRVDVRSARGLEALVAQGCTALEEIRGVEAIETMGQLHFTGLNAMTRLPNFTKLRSIIDLELIDLPGLTNLEQLSALTTVENASLSYMDALTSLHGLEQLASGKRILLEDLLGLETLDGLRGLQTVDILWLQGNRKLQTLAGLTLKRAGELAVRFNEELRSLEGLEMLTDVGTLDVSQNPQLRSVRALAGLETSAKVYVRSNPRLSQCEVDWLATALPAGSMQDLAAGSDASATADCATAADE